MQKIDRSTWPRAEKFGFFSAVSQPFYSVTFRVDVTNLHAYTKQRGLSFYYALVYLATNAVNAVENFRYTIRDGEVYLLDERIPSFTDLKPSSEDFHIVTLPQEETLEQFCAAAKARSDFSVSGGARHAMPQSAVSSRGVGIKRPGRFCALQSTSMAMAAAVVWNVTTSFRVLGLIPPAPLPPGLPCRSHVPC